MPNRTNRDQPQYWLFQASPREDDLRVYLDRKKPGSLITWRATRFKEPNTHMFRNDRVAMWQTRGNAPEAAGIYALGRLTGKFYPPGESWLASVLLEHIRPLDDPIQPDELAAFEGLRSLLVLRPKGFQGSNFPLTEDQWAAIQTAWGERNKWVEPARVSQASVPEIQVLPIEQFLTESTQVAGSGSYEQRQVERELLHAYVERMKRRGFHFDVRRILLNGGLNSLRCDLFENKRNLLIEVKGSASREDIRMAIGELADYRRFLGPREIAILLPERPSSDLENLLGSQQIKIVWRNQDLSFGDNCGGALV